MIPLKESGIRNFILGWGLFCLSFGLFPDDSPGILHHLETSADWKTGLLVTRFSEDKKVYNGTFRKSQNLQQTFTREKILLITKILRQIPYDSQKSIGEFWLRHPEEYTRFNLDVMKKEERIEITFDQKNYAKLTFFINIYSDILPYLKELPVGYRPDPLPTYLSYVPAIPFSGLVIYARDPLHPRNNPNAPKELLRTAVFPKVYMEDGTVILRPSFLKSSFLYRWGTAGYAENSGSQDLDERIGLQPLRTYALSFYGKNKTDIVISSDAGHRILSSPHNKKLLEEGRVVIIVQDAHRTIKLPSF